MTWPPASPSCAGRQKRRGIVDGIGVAKRFTATVLAVTREQSSTRALVRLRTSPWQFHADGLEGEMERPEWPSGLAMARRLNSLVGHRELLWVEVAVMNGGAGKVRVIRVRPHSLTHSTNGPRGPRSFPSRFRCGGGLQQAAGLAGPAPVD